MRHFANKQAFVRWARRIKAQPPISVVIGGYRLTTARTFSRSLFAGLNNVHNPRFWVYYPPEPYLRDCVSALHILRIDSATRPGSTDNA